MSEDQELLARIGQLAELNRPLLKTVIRKRQGATQLDRISLEAILIGELHVMHLMADEEEELRDDIPPVIRLS
ncbi:MAG: hypothetical protein LQ341_004082 [Variospora aurantia]|nr:MAG: hypothetical protein LQ341_004082 [Variospora aurantia]